MRLSIVIPVYRTQDTLARCIGSILLQSFTDYEIILVDDGSPDNCPFMCDDYARKDKRVKVIHKANGGLSDARNAGIEIAQGEYVTFMDSDDAMQEDTLLPLMNELYHHADIDVLEYPVWERLGHPTREHLLTFSPHTYNNPLDYWLEERGFCHTYAWNKIFRRELFDKVRFPKGKNFEDVLTIPRLLGLSSSYQTHPIIRVTNIGRYLYYWNKDGITARAKYEDLRNLYKGHNKTLAYIFQDFGDNTKYYIKYSLPLQDFMLQILNVLLDLYELSGKYEDNPPLINYAKKLSRIVAIPPLKLILFNILGYHILCKLNKLIHSIYKHR